MLLRDYTPADKSECVRIFASNIPRYFRDHERPDFEQFLDEQGCPYLILQQGNEKQIVGCGGYAVRADGGADLCWGMIAQEFHRQGLGEYLLVARLMRIVAEPSAKSVRLGTCQLTSAFFEKYGFHVQSINAGAIANGLDDVEMNAHIDQAFRARIQQQWQELNA